MKLLNKKLLKYIFNFLPLCPICPNCGAKLPIFHRDATWRYKPSCCPVCKKEYEEYLSLRRCLITVIIMGICLLFVESINIKMQIVFLGWSYIFIIHTLRKLDKFGIIGEQLVTIKTKKNDVFDCFNTWDTYYIYFVDIERVPLTSGYPIKLEYVNDWFTNVKSRISFIEIEPEQKFLQVGSKFCLFYNKQQKGKGSIIFYQKI